MGVAPRIMATGGLFRAPIVGSVLRRCGHLQVNRGRADVTKALDLAVDAISGGAVVAGYPEGRISLEPGLWPERGRTGIARLSLMTGAPVIPVSQWGSHEVMVWNGFLAMGLRLVSSIWRRPVVRFHFGDPVELSDLSADEPGHAQVATDRIMTAILEGLRPLRADEPGLPRYTDPTRPLTTARAFVPR